MHTRSAVPRARNLHEIREDRTRTPRPRLHKTQKYKYHTLVACERPSHYEGVVSSHIEKGKGPPRTPDGSRDLVGCPTRNTKIRLLRSLPATRGSSSLDHHIRSNLAHGPREQGAWRWGQVRCWDLDRHRLAQRASRQPGQGRRRRWWRASLAQQPRVDAGLVKLPRKRAGVRIIGGWAHLRACREREV